MTSHAACPPGTHSAQRLLMPRVLVVEDEPDLRALFAAALRDAGYEVVEARDGVDGLAQLSADPELVVLDLMLPGANGYEFLEQLRGSGEHRTVPVIAVSGTATGRWSLTHGADRYLAKPFSVDALTELAREVTIAGRAAHS
jgi:CheY-like chemotaxis protein